jgi:hypothetical protein
MNNDIYLNVAVENRHLFHSKNICPLLFLSKDEEGAYIF